MTSAPAALLQALVVIEAKAQAGTVQFAALSAAAATGLCGLDFSDNGIRLFLCKRTVGEARRKPALFYSQHLCPKFIEHARFIGDGAISLAGSDAFVNDTLKIAPGQPGNRFSRRRILRSS